MPSRLKGYTAILFVCIFYWFLDSAWSYFSFDYNIKKLIFTEPGTFLDAILLKVSPFQIVSRLLVIFLFTALGILIVEYIIKKKSAEKALQESEARYERIIRGANDGVWEWNLTTNEVSFSERWKSMLGHKENEIKDDFDEWEKRVHPDDIARCWEYINAHLHSDNELYELEHRLRHKDSSYVWILARAFTIRDNKGNPIMLTGSHTDLTARKNAEKKMRENAIFLKTLINSIPSPVFYKDKDGKYLGFNRAFEEFFGESSENLIGKSVFDISPMEHAKMYHSKDQELFDTRISQKFEAQVKDAKGHLRDVVFHKAPFKDADGRINGLIGTILDMTDYNKALSEKEEAQIKLNQAQKLEAVGKLAGGIAHDFNNILYPIMGFAQLSQNILPKDHPVQENLTDILNGAKRATNLVKRILHFSRQRKPELKPILLQPVIKETKKLLRSTIPSNIHLQLNLYDGQDVILCDESEIHEVILNLCTNAYHAILGDHGEIIIGLEKQKPSIDLERTTGEYLCLSVKDNGVGIPEKIKDMIFEPYMTTKDVGKGSGLGLSVVYGIVKNYKGEISVESDQKNGTIFKIYLPITDQAVDIEKDLSINYNDKSGNECILFVDDENSIIKLGVRALENSGYRVTGINDSNEAFKIFKSNPDDFDLVITDMAMPGIVGSELAKKILDIRPDTPIIICSGYSEKLDKMKAKELNISAFLDKPLLVDNLINEVRKVLDKEDR